MDAIAIARHSVLNSKDFASFGESFARFAVKDLI
jgi:hypothetical protein